MRSHGKIGFRGVIELMVIASALLTLSVPARASDPPRHVVGASEVQARLDRQISQSDADRQAIQDLLRNPQVRRLAGSAGLDLERASASAATLSGAPLARLGAQARELNERLAGDDYIVISATALIIILLLIILLAR